jgi:hypothetical protein
MRLLILSIISGILLVSCSKEQKGTITSGPFHSSYDFDKFINSSGTKSSSPLKGSDTIGYFKDLIENGKLNCITGAYHSATRYRVNSSDSSIAVKIYNHFDDPAVGGLVYQDVYVSSVYAEPFNSSDGWTMAFWFKCDLDNQLAFIVDVRDEKIHNFKGIDYSEVNSMLMASITSNNDFRLIFIKPYGDYYYLENGDQMFNFIRTDTLFKTEPVHIDNLKEWNHYSLSFSEDTVKIYLNGLFSYSKDNAGVLTSGKFTSFYCEPYWGDDYLDDLNIWNRPLSDTEILDLYNSQK